MSRVLNKDSKLSKDVVKMAYSTNLPDVRDCSIFLRFSFEVTRAHIALLELK
jgi:hypothetical protein